MSATAKQRSRSESAREPKVMVHVVAYNAVSTLVQTLDRIPQHLWKNVAEVCVFDDHSPDQTHLIGHGYRAHRDLHNLHIFRNPENLGYGGNQKLGYRYAIDKGFDYVVLLHGDGQYAPEEMESLLKPLIDGEADAVFGSRMLDKGRARQGGMPLYKWVGNRILSNLQNELLGMNLSEFHSGYRAYRVSALESIPFEANSDDFHFDTQIIIQLMAGGHRIREVPIPTYYGDEICHVNGMKYAKDVMRSVFEFRRHRAGLVSLPEYSHVSLPRYEEKESPLSSHQKLVQRVRPGSKVLDVGCASGYLATQLKAKGCEVVGVDVMQNDAGADACDRYFVADLEQPWTPGEDGFDYIIFGDIIEHLRNIDIVDRCRGWLSPQGRVLASTGNVALWYIRLQLAIGRFDYTPRGILDETHVKLYTRKTFRELFTTLGYRVEHEDFTTIPFERLLDRVVAGTPVAKLTHLVEEAGYRLARLWPELMAYQIVLELTEARSRRSMPLP